jgi:hypothetical protein
VIECEIAIVNIVPKAVPIQPERTLLDDGPVASNH